MNCQDIARILDEQEVDSLLAKEQSEVQAHLATCRDCAHDWQIHVQLSGAAIPAVPDDLRAQYLPNQTKFSGAAARRGSRFVVIGTIVVVAVAAAMLAVQLAGPMKPVVASVESSHADSSTPADQPIADSASVLVEGVEQPASGTEQPAVASKVNEAGLKVLLLPLRFESGVMADKPAVETFNSLLLQALRRIPDVNIEVSGKAGSGQDQNANRITVVSPQFTTLTSGQRMYRYSVGGGRWGNGPSAIPAIEVVAESATAKFGANGPIRMGDFSAGTFTLQLNIDGSGVPTRDLCGHQILENVSRVPRPEGSDNMCSSADQIATSLINWFRQAPELPATDNAQFSARLRDASLQSSERQRAFTQLRSRSRENGIPLNSADIEAITAYTGGLPSEQRALNWTLLRGMKQPILIQPLLNALRHDGDEKVRLEALATLIVDYGGDSVVRGALESVAREDASRFVRMAAQRPLSGEEQWQSYAVEVLANTGLPATERLAPVIYGRRSLANPETVQQATSILASEQVTNQLLDIFQELKTEVRKAGPENMQGVRLQEEAMRNVLTLLSSTNASAALDLQIRYLENPLPGSAATTMQVLLAVARQRDDPRASKVLADIAAGKAGDEVRDMLERMQTMLPPF